jgi:hypothetical protein
LTLVEPQWHRAEGKPHTPICELKGRREIANAPPRITAIACDTYAFALAAISYDDSCA